MISKDPQRRPPGRALLNHPFFWPEERVLAFLQDVSDRVEKLDYGVNPLRTLEMNGRLVVRNDWSVHLHESIRADLRKFRGYQGTSVRDLMRALRNKKHHYHELTADMQAILGTVPRDFTRYWVHRFPHLVSHAWHALGTCAKENSLRAYYSEGYTFPRSDYFELKYEDFVPEETAAAARLVREQPVRKYSKELRQRLGGAGVLGSAVNGSAQLMADGGEQLMVDGSPRMNRRGTYNFQKTETAVESVEPTNWRKKKKEPTPAWTLSQ